MDNKDIVEEIKKITAEQFAVDIDDIFDDTSFFSDLNADSLDAVEIVMMIEDKFNITISDEDGESFMTVQAVANYVEKKLEDQGGK